MNQELITLVGTPALILAFIIILTDSSLLRSLVSKIRGKELYTRGDFEDWLFTVPRGFFWHKLLTCSLCHAFHTAWISALAMIVTGRLGLSVGAGYAGLIYIAAYAYLLHVRGSTPAAPLVPEPHTHIGDNVEFNIPPTTAPAGDWPSPVKGYMSRLVVERRQKPGGKVEVIVSGMDALAQTTIAVMGNHAPCNFPRCEELKAAYEAELKAAEEAKCPKCEIGTINRKYWDIAIALQGG